MAEACGSLRGMEGHAEQCRETWGERVGSLGVAAAGSGWGGGQPGDLLDEAKKVMQHGGH